MERPRFGVIGCGSIGKRHTRNLLALGEKEIVAFDPTPERRAEAEALGVTTVATIEELLDRAPHAVVVASPTRMHVEHALAAAERGAHLFVEKPVAEVLDADFDRLVSVVREKKLVSLVGCNLRFHPGLQRVKALLDEKRIGKIVSTRVQFGYWLPDWRPHDDYRKGYSARKDLGGGIILDAIHELDYIRWLMRGEGEVTKVLAMSGHLSSLEIDTEDMAAILLRFASGAIGEVHLDYVQRVYTRNCWIVGDQGTIAWDYPSPEVRLYDPAKKAWETSQNVASWEPNEMYVDELRHFLACLEGKATSEQSIEDGAKVLRIADEAKRAPG